MNFIRIDLEPAWDELMYLWKSIWMKILIVFDDQTIDFYSLFYAGVVTFGLICCFKYFFNWYDDPEGGDADHDYDY